jgi:hypothetical protein
LRYIKARLEESFTGRWTLAGAAVAGGWGTTIEIRSPEALGSAVAAETRFGAAVKEQPI